MVLFDVLRLVCVMWLCLNCVAALFLATNINDRYWYGRIFAYVFAGLEALSAVFVWVGDFSFASSVCSI